MNLVFAGVPDLTFIETELASDGWTKRSLQAHQYLRGWGGVAFWERSYAVKGHSLLRHFWRWHLRLWWVYSGPLGYECFLGSAHREAPGISRYTGKPVPHAVQSYDSGRDEVRRAFTGKAHWATFGPGEIPLGNPTDQPPCDGWAALLVYVT